ncbi:MAG: Omp28-related outer membrane protein [Saprospiraceae bacterium]|nr:Omp28-related outer membrane protein [Saprospiraceae bacterium]
MSIRLLFIITFFVINSCADWETKTDIIESGIINTERVILVEDFTGASCPNCPVGTAELENILEKYPSNVVVLGIHSRFLADPAKTGDPNLITKDANDIEKLLGNYVGKPEASINRRLYTGNNIRISRPDTWITYIDQELKREAEARLKIEKNYDDNSRELNIKITATSLIDILFPIHLHVAISESGIFTSQSGPSGVLDNYEQKHVLRKLLTPVGGELMTDGLTKDKSITKEYKFILPAETEKLWKANNCSIVAFISKNETEKVILQATEEKLK